MAKLYYRHGTMRSGKSQDVIRAYDSYEKSGRKAIIAKPSIDTRDEDLIATRKGYNLKANILNDLPGEIINLINNEVRNSKKVEAVIIDEAQFLTLNQVRELILICDSLDIPVLCYGLRTDFKGDLFEGSKLLMQFADNIEEIKTVCQYCNKKAIMNLRAVQTKEGLFGALFSEEQISIGDDEYIQTCREHYLYFANGGKIEI